MRGVKGGGTCIKERGEGEEIRLGHPGISRPTYCLTSCSSGSNPGGLVQRGTELAAAYIHNLLL